MQRLAQQKQCTQDELHILVRKALQRDYQGDSNKLSRLTQHVLNDIRHYELDESGYLCRRVWDESSAGMVARSCVPDSGL